MYNSNAIKKSVAGIVKPLAASVTIAAFFDYLATFKRHPEWNQLHRVFYALLGGFVFIVFIILPLYLFWQLVIRKKSSADSIITGTDGSEVPATHILYGALTAAAMIIADTILLTLRLEWNPVLRWAGVVLFFIGILLNARAFSRAGNVGTVFSNVLVSCLKMVVIATVIICAWMGVMPIIFPEFKAQALEHTRQYLQHKGTYTSAEISQKIVLEDKYFAVAHMFAGSILFLIIGCVFSLITAAIIKKDRGKASLGRNS